LRTATPKRQHDPLRVLVAGTFDPAFARNRVIIALLRRGDFDVEVLQRPLWGTKRYALIDQPKTGLALRAVRAYAGLLWGLLRAERPALLVVLYPGYFDMPLVAAIARLRGIPILFDTFISLHDTVVGDRALRRADSFAGRATRFVDKLACRLADLVLVDTPPQAAFFAELTGVEQDRFRVLWLGAQEDVFYPRDEILPEAKRVLFHGTFIRLQGLDIVVRAAKLLDGSGIHFRVIGDGQERPAIEQLARELEVENVVFTGLVPLGQIPAEIASASLCLGVFGTSSKARRVVPNKVFECLAVGRPVVTADTPAVRAAFDGEVALVPAGDAGALATSIRELLADHDRLAALAAEGHARFERSYSEAALSRALSEWVVNLAAGGRRPVAKTPGPRSGKAT
jgi:glycosyltransferase involved in cell wall biosynthesis